MIKCRLQITIRTTDPKGTVLWIPRTVTDERLSRRRTGDRAQWVLETAEENEEWLHKRRGDKARWGAQSSEHSVAEVH